MLQQPNLFSSQVPDDAGDSDSSKTPEQIPRWLRRLDLFVRVIVRLYLGLIVLVLPWLHFWDDNHLLVVIPHLAPLALSGVTRGIVSGLGLLNIYIAIHDAIHFRES